MRASVVWADKVQDKQNNAQSIYCLTFKPDGTQLIVGAGNRVLVYETADGELVQSLKGHKDTVYCLSYAKDGKRFASGGADKTVIIWTDELEGILRFSHPESIQALSFNPVTGVLVSCTAVDFGFWSMNEKNVDKIKVPSRVTSCAWTNDGQYLALGLFNGNVSIRNRNGDQKVLITRPGGNPVWSLKWNPSAKDKTDILAVCDWGQNLSFYMLSGRQVGKDRQLEGDPCALDYFHSGEYLVVGGTDKKVALYSRDGVHLTDIGEQEGWVWSAAVRPNQNYVAVGCDDGTIALYQLIFATVHGLYRDRYAYRSNMTDVIIQDLSSESQNRLRCKELVKKIAIYKDRLAVQLPNQINVYDVITTDDGPSYRLRDKLKGKFECNLLVVCSSHVILCQERRLQSYRFDGTKEREWVVDSLIRYIKVTGGPAGREGLLVGLKNGAILKIFVDNAFPIELIKQNTPVRCLDLSCHRNKVAVVDDNSTCSVYDLKTKELLFSESNANSVAWNTQNNDMLCFSGNGFLHIKADNFPLHQQKLQGFVVGFSGSNIYCLHVFSMTAVEVPQSHSMFQYLKNKEFRKAYRVACLGVTEADWEALAVEALEGLDLDVAKHSFARVRNLRYLDLIHSIEERRKSAGGELDRELTLADVYAYQGQFDDAAKIYVRNGQARKALEMFCDLRMFDKAKDYLDATNADDAKFLMKKQAEWCKTANDPTLAVDILAAAGEEIASVNVMGENGMVQKLIEKARKLNKAEHEVLAKIAEWLQKLDQVPLAAEVCQKIGDNKMLVDIYVRSGKWEDAFALVDRQPELSHDVYVPYANWLAENDRFEEAQAAFHKAGMQDRATEVLEVLTHNAVMEYRFNDAGYYFFELAKSVLSTMEAQAAGDETAEPDAELLARYKEYQRRADLYFAYHAIQRYIDEPFTSHLPESLFNIARYILQEVGNDVPHGISRVSCLFALAKQSRNLGAFKVARTAYEKLQGLKLPANVRGHIDLGSITIRSKPFTDKEELQPMCYRCSTPNPLSLTGAGKCINCGQPFVYSQHSFEVLPLVEFFLDVDISDEEALRLIANDSTIASKSTSGNAQVLNLDHDSGESSTDPFMDQLMEFEPTGSGAFTPIRVNRSTLKQMPSHEVFVQKFPLPLTPRYYRNVVPEMNISLCKHCNKFFQSDDYELLVLQHGHCPFCRKNDSHAVEDKEASDKKAIAGMSSSSTMA